LLEYALSIRPLLDRSQRDRSGLFWINGGRRTEKREDGRSRCEI